MTIALYITVYVVAALFGFALGYGTGYVIEKLRRRRSHPVETITSILDTDLARRTKVARRTP